MNKKISIYVPYRNYFLKSFIKKKGKIPFDFLWGINNLDKKKFIIDTSFSKRGDRSSYYAKFFWIFEKIFIKILGVGAPFEVYFENKNKINNKDIIFCCNDALGVVFLFFKRIGLIKSKVIVLFQALSERRILLHNNSYINYILIKFIIKKCDLVLTLSKLAKRKLISEYRIPKNKIKVLDFGVDISFWKPKRNNKKQKYILSVGNDSNRDYETLINAVQNKFKLIVVTKKEIKKKVNTKIFKNVSIKKLRELYQNAHLTVIPSKKILSENAGMSCIMQSMASGTPVITSNLPALKERFKDKKTIFYFNAESSKSLKAVIEQVYYNKKFLRIVSKNAKNLINKEYNYTNLSNQISTILEKV